MPFKKQRAANFLDERKQKNRDKLYEEFWKDANRVSDNSDNFANCRFREQRGSALRFEGVFSITVNDRTGEGPVNLFMRHAEFLNVLFFNWSKEVFSRHCRLIAPQVFPGIVKTNNRMLTSLIQPILLHRSNGVIHALQAELAALIELLLLYNLTGDPRALEDPLFRITGIRENVKEYGKKFTRNLPNRHSIH